MQHDFHLLAGGAQTIDVAGKFFKYKSGNGAIRVKDNRGGTIDLLPGQGVWNVDYNSLSIQDISGLTNAGVLLAGDFDFHDDRISGTVDVVDGGRARTIANQAFMGQASQGPVAAQLSHAQLFNPVASNKRVVIESITMSAFAAINTQMAIYIRPYSTALTTLITNGVAKLAGGTASLAELRSQTNGAVLGTSTFAAIDTLASVPWIHGPKEPYVLLPGQGLIVAGTVANTSIGAAFEWFEESL